MRQRVPLPLRTLALYARCKAAFATGSKREVSYLHVVLHCRVDTCMGHWSNGCHALGLKQASQSPANSKHEVMHNDHGMVPSNMRDVPISYSYVSFHVVGDILRMRIKRWAAVKPRRLSIARVSFED